MRRATPASLVDPFIRRDCAMSDRPKVKSAEFSLASVPAFWPMAMAAAVAEEGVELYARNLRFVEEEIKIHDDLRPTLATPNRVGLTEKAP